MTAWRAAWLLLGLSLAGAAAARNVALLIAVGQFRDPALKSFELRGPAIDIDSVQQTLTELHACTHLNDMLRSLAELPALVKAL